MDPSSEERRRLARLLELEVIRAGSNKKAVYTKAEVNSATFENALAGQNIKARSLNAIARNLWPETEGDWRKIPGLRHGSQRERTRADIMTWRMSESTRERMLRLLEEAVFEDEADGEARTEGYGA